MLLRMTYSVTFSAASWTAIKLATHFWDYQNLKVRNFFWSKIQFLTRIYVTLLLNLASWLCRASCLIALLVNAFSPIHLIFGIRGLTILFCYFLPRLNWVDSGQRNSLHQVINDTKALLNHRQNLYFNLILTASFQHKVDKDHREVP